MLIEREEIGFKGRITVLGTLDETLEHTALSALVSGLIIVAVSVLVLEDLGINNILKGFMRLVLKTGLNEIVLLELEFSLGSDGTLVELLSDDVVFGVTLKISLEVIAVHLLLFCEPSEEVGVVLSPSLALSLKHALLSAFMVLGVHKLSCSEFLNLIEGAIEAADGLFNVVPSLVEILAIWGWEVNSVLSELTINLSEGLVHSIELLMSFLQSLQLVGGINENAISLIRVNMNVHVCGRDSLQSGVRAVTENVQETDSHILFSNIVVRHSREHERIVVLLLSVFILQTNNLEALTANIASVDGTFSDKVEHLFVGVRIILNTRASADDDSP